MESPASSSPSSDSGAPPANGVPDLLEPSSSGHRPAWQLAGVRMKQASRTIGKGAARASSISSKAPCDLMFDRSEFLALDRQLGPVTLDAHSNDSGTTAQVTHFCSPARPFAGVDCANNCVFLCPPFKEAGSYLDHYLACKKASPTNTSAIIVLPDWETASWRPMLSSLLLVKTYPSGTVLFEHRPPQGPVSAAGACPWPVCVYYDPPATAGYDVDSSINAAAADDWICASWERRVSALGTSTSVLSSSSFAPPPPQSSRTAVGSPTGTKQVSTTATSGPPTGTQQVSTLSTTPAVLSSVSTVSTSSVSRQERRAAARALNKVDAFVGRTAIKTDHKLLVLQVIVNGRQLSALVDSGASRDFVSSRAVSTLELPLQPIKPVRVRLANGSISTTSSSCVIPFTCSSYSASRTFTVTELDAFDLILGISWLQECNPHIDWSSNTVRLGPHLLQGSAPEPRPCLQLITERQMDRLLSKHPDTPVWLAQLKTTDNYDESAWDPPPPIPSTPSSSAATAPPPTSPQVETDQSPEWTARLNTYLSSKPDLLSPPTGLPPSRPEFDFRVPLPPDHTPPHGSVIRMSPLELQELRRQLDDFLAKGWIRPSNNSPYGAPVLFARKPDGSLRMVISYKKLNSLTIPTRFPLPRVDECLDQLQGACVFTSLDLASGYHQLRVHPEDSHKLAFKSRYGQFEWVVMPMGTTSSPSFFSRFMAHLLAPFIDKFVVVYLDDILIYSRSPEEHLQHVQAVLDVLAANDLHLSLKKSKFGRHSTKFLGYQLSSRDGTTTLSIDPGRIEAVQNWPLPRTQTEVRSFLGFVAFCRRWIRNFSSIAAPLTDLTRSSVPFPATLPPDAIESFNALKQAMTTAPVLAIPVTGPDAEFTIYTDASSRAIGCVLLQQTSLGLQPVAYDSRKLKSEETRYPVHELELLGVVHALSAYRTYIEGCKHITLCTDHDSLRHFLSQPHHSGRQARWLDIIQPYAPRLDIVYKRGDLNKADALSRRPDLMASLTALNLIGVALDLDSDLLDDIKAAYSADPYYSADNSKRLPGVEQAADGFWYFRGRLCIPSNQPLRLRLLHEFHDAAYAGHPGITKTLASVSRAFWWPHMYRTVKSYCRACAVCQRVKSVNALPFGLLHPHDIPTRPWSHVSLDWVGPLPPSAGFDSILTIVCMLTKYAYFIPCNKTMTSQDLASAFMERVVSNHGLPTKLVSDRDPRITGDFFSSFFRRLGSKLNISTAYHPQTDGQTEVIHPQLGVLLRAYAHPLNDTWAEQLPVIQLAYNSTTSSATGVTPFAANYGFEPTLPSAVIMPSFVSPAADDYLDRLRDIQSLVRSHLQVAQDRARQVYDRHHQSFTFAVGDRVRLSTAHLRLQGQTSKKFKDRFIGPLTVTEVISPVVYRLQLPETMSRVHPVFHISKLRPWADDDEHPDRPVEPVPQPVAQDALADQPDLFNADSILSASIDTEKGQPMIFFKVRWSAPYDDPSYDTDEPYRNVATSIALQTYLSSPAWAAFRATPEFRAFVTARPRVLGKKPQFLPL